MEKVPIGRVWAILVSSRLELPHSARGDDGLAEAVLKVRILFARPGVKHSAVLQRHIGTGRGEQVKRVVRVSRRLRREHGEVLAILWDEPTARIGAGKRVQ